MFQDKLSSLFKVLVWVNLYYFPGKAVHMPGGTGDHKGVLYCMQWLQLLWCSATANLSMACNTALFRTTGSYMSWPNPPLPVTMYQFLHLAHFFYPDNGDSRFLGNSSNHLTGYTWHPQQTVRLHETVFAILRTSNGKGGNIWIIMFIMSKVMSVTQPSW